MFRYFVMFSVLLGPLSSHAALNHELEGVFQDGAPQKVESRALWKRTATFTPKDVSIVYLYYEPKDPKTPVIERRLRGTYRLEAIPPSSSRHFKMTIKLAESTLIQKTWSKLGQSMGLTPCAKINVAVNLLTTSCGEFRVEEGRAYYRVFLEDPKSLLLSGPARTKRQMGAHINIYPLKKTKN